MAGLQLGPQAFSGPSRGRSALPRHPAAPMDLRQTSSKASAWVGMEQVLLLVAAVVVLSASTAVSTRPSSGDLLEPEQQIFTP